MDKSGHWAVGLAGIVGLSVLVSWLVGWQASGWADALTTLVPVPIAFWCGLACRRRVGLAAVLWMAATAEITALFNPFVLVITLGPWLVGTIIREHQQMARSLENVGREIEAESQRLADEAVRLERSHIARELHDIVAHCVSMMVVQAYAGERLIGDDRTSAAEAFDHISDAAGQLAVRSPSSSTCSPPMPPPGPTVPSSRPCELSCPVPLLSAST